MVRTFKKGIPVMLKFYRQDRERCEASGHDQDAVVSFEYVIVAACIIAVVSLGFGTGGLSKRR